MPVTPIIVCVATFCSTLLGGLFAMRFKDRLHLILGFSAGAVIGVAFFDLIPEAIELAEGHFHASTIMSIAAAGFIGYMILDRVMMFHGHSHTEEDHALHVHAEDDHGHNHDHEHAGHHHGAHGRGQLGAISLSIHSFLDGVGIGLAYQVSPAVAAVVTVAVLTHDFSDGINTVNLILKDKGERRRALRWLFIDAVAPVFGMISTLFFSLPQAALAVVLAVFAGFFLYIGASDLLPESHHRHPKALTTVMTVVGVAVLYVVVKIAG